MVEEVEEGEEEVVELLAEEEVMVESVVAVGEADDAGVVLTAVELTGVVDAVLIAVELAGVIDAVPITVELIGVVDAVMEIVELPVEVAVDVVELLYSAEELVTVEFFKNEAVEEAVVVDVVEFSYGAEELALLSSMNCAKRVADVCGATYL